MLGSSYHIAKAWWPDALLGCSLKKGLLGFNLQKGAQGSPAAKIMLDPYLSRVELKEERVAQAALPGHDCETGPISRRQRYLDMIVTPGVMDTLRARSRIISKIRNFLDDRDYLEVSLPLIRHSHRGYLEVSPPLIRHSHRGERLPPWPC